MQRGLLITDRLSLILKVLFLFLTKSLYLSPNLYILYYLMTNLLLLGFLPSGSEWIIIALVILLLFGGKKIPELMRGLGKGVKSFKDGVNEAKEEINKAKDEIDEPAKTTDKDKK